MDQVVNKRSTKPARERQNGIDRAIEILDALLRTHTPTKVGDLAKQIGAPRSTLYSITNRLIEAGILEQAGDEGTVYFGQAAHLYGRAYADANPLHRRCREALDRLAMQTAATAQLCALRGNKYVVVDTRDGSGVFRITTDIGVEVPIPWTASGRLLLDHMSAAEILGLHSGGRFQAARWPRGRGQHFRGRYCQGPRRRQLHDQRPLRPFHLLPRRPHPRPARHCRGNPVFHRAG